MSSKRWIWLRSTLELAPLAVAGQQLAEERREEPRGDRTKESAQAAAADGSGSDPGITPRSTLGGAR